MLSIPIVPGISHLGWPFMIIVQPVGGNRRRYRTGLHEKSRGYHRTRRFESINTPKRVDRSNRTPVRTERNRRTD